MARTQTKNGQPGVYNSSPITLSDGDGGALQLDANGYQIISTGVGATNLGKAEDAAHVSGDTGVAVLAVYKTTPTQLAGTDADYSVLETDANGLLYVNAQNVPSATSLNSLTTFQNLGANATLNVKASTGNVYSLYCHNIGGTQAYIQLHNTATTPSGGAAPAFSFAVPAGGTTLIEKTFFGDHGYNFSTGIAFAFSTTETTYTAGTAGNQVTQIMYK